MTSKLYKLNNKEQHLLSELIEIIETGQKQVAINGQNI